MKTRWMWLALLTLVICTACTVTPAPGTSIPASPTSASAIEGTAARVTRVIDGDTIDVQIGDVGYRVRYIGINTPERDEPCYEDAANANTELVGGRTVTLVRDSSNTDIYGRLLRYVYAGDVFVNAELVRDGWAENAVYPPDTRFEQTFHQLEAEAQAAHIGCHPSGIFDDGSDTR